MFDIKLWGCIFVIIWIYLLWSRRKFYILWTKISGPLGYPLIGIILDVYKREAILNSLNNYHIKYAKTYVTWLGTAPFLITAEPEKVEKFLTSSQLIDKADIYNAVSDLIGDGLFSCTTTRWKHHRKHLSPAFHHKVLLSFLPIFNWEVKKLNSILNKLIGTGENNLADVIQTCSFNTAAETTMGKPLGEARGNSAELLGCFQLSLEIITNKAFAPWKRNKHIFKLTSEYHKFQKIKKKMDEYIQLLIEKKVQSLKTSENNMLGSEEDSISKPRSMFIDHAIDLVRKGEFTWSDVEAEAFTMIFGAFETTSNSLNNVLTCLAMFPQYQDKVFEEIFKVFPERDFDVQYEDIQKLVYMEMAINETMRVMAPVPLVARTVMSDIVLFDDILLPKGLQVAVNIFSMHRDESIWGPDAKNYNPDHFLPENFAKKHPYAFIPFTKGTRMCIGVKYSMIFLKLSLAKILRNYRFTTTFEFKNLEYLEDISLKFVKTPKLEIHRRTY